MPFQQKIYDVTRHVIITIRAILDIFFRHLGKIFFVAVLVSSFAVYASPALSMFLGDIFFGGVKPLYNITFSQVLYAHAVKPPFHQVAPRYAHHQLSRTYFIEGELFRSLDEAQRELELYPDSVGTYYILGLTYGYMGREEDAIVAFSRYLDFNPQSWPARNDKAWLQFRLGDIDGAMVTIEPIVAQYEKVPWVQNTYCTLLINKGDVERATEACHNAKLAIDKLSEVGWGRAYPGNDPRVYPPGLRAIRLSIDENLATLEKQARKE